MKILITGANGYLGQGIVKQLLDYGHQIVATDIVVDRIDNRAERVACNLFEVDNPFYFFGQPNILLHLAWRDGFVHYSDAHINDLPLHYKFINSFAQSEVNSIAVLGTMHEVGFFEGPIKEDTPCNPLTPYGIAKNSLRQLVSMICSKNKKNYLWLRGFYIVGTSRNGASIFAKISTAEAEGKSVFPFTSGQNQFDFIDYDDFCRQVAKAVVQKQQLGVINICSGFPEKLADRVERFIRENGYKIRLDYGAFPNRSYESKALWGDNHKITAIMSETPPTL